MSRLFIARPIFAWVLAIVVMMAGLGALLTLPVAQYPDIAPTEINIRATYPGASAETLENSVTQILEQQITGLDGMLYFSANSSSRGNASVTVTFAKGTDPDIAQVQVQNAIAAAVSRLPAPVQQQGVRVFQGNAEALLGAAIYDTTGRRSNNDIADYLTSNVQDQLARVEGVADLFVFGSPHAMRIWLNPHRLAAVSLMPSDVIQAIQAQNTEVAAGEIGSLPAPPGQMLNATVTAQSRLQTPEEFRAITLKTLPDGSAVRIGDVARVEVGSENYSAISRFNGYPASGMQVILAPEADALDTAERVKARLAELSQQFPEGLEYDFTNDTTDFIKLSVNEVVKSLAEAVVLVVIVMFVFLQTWRATLVPAIAVPVVLLGTFAIFWVVGFSVNTLTLFGLVLAIGLLVDDAIVVVENVERLMEENPGMSPREATIRSMAEIQMALVAVALVLVAVFVPMAFFGGSTGVIYRQFAVTMITAMVLSNLVALILSPALTSTLLHRPDAVENGWLPRSLPRFHALLQTGRDKFNRGFERLSDSYRGAVVTVIERKWWFIGIYLLVCALLAALFFRLPSGFLPYEDQGVVRASFRLPPGATQTRALEVRDAIEEYWSTHEKERVQTFFISVGGGPGAQGQGTGQSFIKLADWEDRPGEENSAAAIAEQANSAFRGLRDAQVTVSVPGAVRGLGNANSFSMLLQNSTGMPRAEFIAARNRLLAEASANPMFTNVRLGDIDDQASVRIEVDPQKATAFGISQADVNATLGTAWGGRYVNDYIENGRVKRVYVQGDAPYRADPASLGHWYVRTSGGEMAPFSAFAQIDWTTAPPSLSRFMGLPSFDFQVQTAPGVSTGEAMDVMESLAAEIPGTSVAWQGASYEQRQSSGQAPMLYAISLLVVFLCLAALFESWSIPLAVILVIPLGLVGAIIAVSLRGLENDVYLQIGLLTTMGLAAKNAILMIEFAEQGEKRGMRVIDAALEAARIRLRPILMTSFAFMFGVLPLALAAGPGANSRIAIGTSVIGGMFTATLLAIFFIPLFFVMVRRGRREMSKKLHERFDPHEEEDRLPIPELAG